MTTAILPRFDAIARRLRERFLGEPMPDNLEATARPLPETV